MLDEKNFLLLCDLLGSLVVQKRIVRAHNSADILDFLKLARYSSHSWHVNTPWRSVAFFAILVGRFVKLVSFDLATISIHLPGSESQ